MVDVKYSPSICLCLSPAFFAFCLSHPLQDFTLHIPFAGCYLEQWFHLLQKTVPHLFRVGEREKKLLILSSYLPSAFFLLLLVIFKGGGRKLFDNALSYLLNTKLKWMSLIFSQLCETHLRKIFFFSTFFLTVHQPSFDPLECIKHSQIKRTWQGIYKQPHTAFSLETPLSRWSIYCQTSVLFLYFRLIHCIFTLLPPTWVDYMMLDVSKFNKVYVSII